jgi:tetratricopeptide (TPR) repeat protein
MQKKNKKSSHKQSIKAVVPIQEKWYRDRMTLLYMAILSVAIFITFFPALSHEFVNWDDDVNVYENPVIDKLSAENVGKIFTSPVIGNYNPLPILTFAIEKHFFGLDPFIYHFDNILLHLLNTLLIYFLATGLGLKRPAAFLLAMLFGIHPMRVESVAWVTERKDVLFGFFTIAAMLCYISWLKGKKRIYLLWTYILFLISVFAKIQAVALPLSLLAIDFFMNRPVKWKLVIEKIPMFLVSLAVGLAGIYFLSEQKSLDPLQYTLAEKLLIGAYSLMIFIVKSMIPYEMSAIYPFPKPGDFPWVFYISPLVILAFALGIFLSLKRTKVLVFGTLFFLFNIMFLLQIVSAGQGFIADRFGYIAYFGLFFIYAYGLNWLLEHRPKWKPALWVTIAALLLVFGGVARNRVYAWKNPETLWTDVLSKYKNVAVAYNNRGKYYREHQQYDKALADYDNLLRIVPDDFNGFNSRGRLWFDLGKFDKALPDFNRSIELNPQFAKAYSNRGAIYGMKNEYRLAADDLTKALELNPAEYVAFSNRALVYLSLNQYQEAAADCDAYLRFKPDEASMWDLAALCYMNMKKYDTALVYADKAIELDLSVGAYYSNRCYIHFFRGDKGKARSDAEKATRYGMKMDPAFVKRLSEP